MDHLLGVVATSAWADHLVLRGSVLLREWLGPAAREPGDIDFVVTPQTMMLDDRRTAAMLDGIVRAVRERPDAGTESVPDLRIEPDVAVTSARGYGYAPARQLGFEWSTSDGLHGGVRVDLAFNERLPLPGARTPLMRVDPGEPIVIGAAGPALALAWKILWLETGLHPQGKDLYDATLLAERTYLPPDLLREVLSRELGADAADFTADSVLAWSVDWANFSDEYLTITGTAQQWLTRLHRALQGTFAA
jgi:hypothetical protein